MCFLFTIRKTAPWTLLPAPWPGICTSLTKKSFVPDLERWREQYGMSPASAVQAHVWGMAMICLEQSVNHLIFDYGFAIY